MSIYGYVTTHISPEPVGKSFAIGSQIRLQCTVHSDYTPVRYVYTFRGMVNPNVTIFTAEVIPPNNELIYNCPIAGAIECSLVVYFSSGVSISGKYSFFVHDASIDTRKDDTSIGWTMNKLEEPHLQKTLYEIPWAYDCIFKFPFSSHPSYNNFTMPAGPNDWYLDGNHVGKGGRVRVSVPPTSSHVVSSTAYHKGVYLGNFTVETTIPAATLEPVPPRIELYINKYPHNGAKYNLKDRIVLTQNITLGSSKIHGFIYSYTKTHGNSFESGTLPLNPYAEENEIDVGGSGIYSITLSALDEHNNIIGSDTIQFEVVYQPLTLDFKIIDTLGIENTTYTLERSSSGNVPKKDVLGRIEYKTGRAKRIEWSLFLENNLLIKSENEFIQNGVIDPFTGKTTKDNVHVSNYGLTQVGNYRVDVRVTDYDGVIVSRSKAVKIDYIKSKVNLNIQPTSDYDPLVVQFSKRTSAGLILPGTFNFHSVEFFYSKVDGVSEGSRVLFKSFYGSQGFSEFIPDFEHSFGPGNYKLYAVVKTIHTGSSVPKTEIDQLLLSISVTAIPNANIDFKEREKPPFKIGDRLSLTPNYDSLPIHKIKSITWIYNFGGRSHTITNSNSNGVWEVQKDFIVEWIDAGNFTIQLEAATENKTFKSPVHRYKVYHDIVPSICKIDLVMDPDQQKAVGTSGQEACDYLYQSIQRAMLKNAVYFAPRTWDEAGRVLSVEKRDITSGPQSTPVVSITIPRRISNKREGVESIKYSELPRNPVDTKEDSELQPRPRGVVFCTPKKDNNQVIRLSSADRYTFTDEYGITVTKKGLLHNPIVLYAQNDTDLKLNAFGESTKNKNLDFSQYPFQPYLTLLREDEYNQTSLNKNKFCVVTYDAVTNSSSIRYSPQYIHSIYPFDVDYLKFRRGQDKSTSFMAIQSETVWDTKSPSSIWGRGDMPSENAAIANKTGWSQGSTDLSWENAGSLLLPAKSGSEINKYTSAFYGQPNTGGLDGAVEKYARRAQFESADNLYTKYGIIDTDGVSRSGFTLNNFTIDGAAANALVGVSQTISKTSNNLIPGVNDLIRPVGKSGRYYIFSKQKGIYVWDEYLSKDAISHVMLSGVPENIINLEKIGDLKILESNLQYDSRSGGFSKFPLSSKYFEGASILLNLNYDNETSDSWATTYSTLTSDQGLSLSVTPSQGNDRVIYADPFDNFAFYSTDSYLGFVNLSNRANTFYYIDKKTGQITEGHAGGKTIVHLDKIQALIGSRDVALPLELHPENESQSVAINGKFGNFPFIAETNIVLADHIKPQINSGISKIWVNDASFQKPLSVKFKTKEWIPDRITLCPEQMSNTDSYVNYFLQAEEQKDVSISSAGSDSYEITVLASNIQKNWRDSSGNYVGGAHYITLGLENFPSGRRSSGFRANYHQNNMSELLEKFSTSVVLVDDNDIKTTIENSSVKDDGLITLLDDNLRCKLHITPLISINKIDRVYLDDRGNTVIKSQEKFDIPKSNIPGAGDHNRLSGTDLISSRGDRFYVISNTSDEVTVYGDAVTLLNTVDKVSVSPFIPTYYSIKAVIGDSPSVSELKFKELGQDGRIEFHPFSHSVVRIQGNSITVVYLDKDKLFSTKYYPKIAFSSTELREPGAGSTTATISFYGVYDKDNKVFSRQLPIGARAKDSQFYHLFSDQGLDNEDEIFIKIQSSEDLDTTKEIELKLINNNTGTEVFDSPYLLSKSTIEQVLESDKRLFKATLKRDQEVLEDRFLSVSIKFTAYDKYGNLVEI